MEFRIIFFITFWQFCYFGDAASRIQKDSLRSDPQGPRVFITVSSLAGKTKTGDVFERQLELNWYNVDEDSSNLVYLLKEDPLIKDPTLQNSLVTISPSKYPNNTFRSGITFPRIQLDLNDPKSTCLGFYIALVKYNELITSNCLRSNPTWMYDNADTLGSKTLSAIMIPGTHNSGSWSVFEPKNDVISTRYLYCQDESILNQLMYGIRYLDIRPSYSRTVSGANETLWISHGIWLTKVPVKEVIASVKAFMKATKEIVILDFHRFENGFSGRLVTSRLAQRRHKELMDLLIKELGEYMIPFTYGYTKTLDLLWNSNKRLLVGYANDQRFESNLFFPAVRHLWGETDTVKGLEEYLNSVMCIFNFGPLSAAMAELTAKATGLLIDKYGGLRKMAQDVNLPVTTWVRERWTHCANIIATDYFLGNDIINLAIESNLKR